MEAEAFGMESTDKGARVRLYSVGDDRSAFAWVTIPCSPRKAVTPDFGHSQKECTELDLPEQH